MSELHAQPQVPADRPTPPASEGSVSSASSAPGSSWSPGRFHGPGELGLALVLIGASSVHLLRGLRILARNSLWNDELFSVIRISGQGPLHTITTYGSANNHVFFNLVSSITPGAGSVDPLHARLWSIIAVLAMQAIVLNAFFRRRWFLAGAVLFALFATSWEWLDLTLQARGYGFLGLAALVSCTTLWRYLEAPSTRRLVLLGAVTVAGAWTVPSYILFAGPLWLLILIAVRRREVLAAGAVTAAVIAAVYAPIVNDVRQEMSRYEAQWGRNYTSLSDVGMTIQTYLLRPGLFGGRALGTALTLTVGLVTVIGAFLLPVTGEIRRLVLVLMGAVGAFFAANLWLGTGVLRTTAFAVVPFAFAVVVLVAGLLDRIPSGDWRQPVLSTVQAVSGVLLVVVLSVQGVTRPRPFWYLPIQDWQAAGAYVDRTFSEGSGLASTGDGWGVLRGAYVDGRFPNDGTPDQSAGLATGRSVLIDTDVRATPSYDFERIASAYSEARFPQRLGGYLRVLAAPPMISNVVEVQVDGSVVGLDLLTDRDRATGPSPRDGATTVRIVPTPGQVSRSVSLVSEVPLPQVRAVRVVTGGRVVALSSTASTAFGASLTVALGDRSVEAVEVTFAASGSGDRLLDLREVWANPVR